MKTTPQSINVALQCSARLLMLPLLVELVARLLVTAGAAAAETVVWRAAIVLVVAALLCPAPGRNSGAGPGMARLLGWGVYSALVLAAGAGTTGWSSPKLAYLALGTGLLVFLFAALADALAQWLDDRRAAARIAICTLLVTISSPIWASPFASMASSARPLVNALISLSPLTYLSTLAGADYLRSDWFYRHTPYGGLRYDYPQPVYATSVFILLLLAVLLLGRRYRSRGRRSAGSSQSPELSP